MSSDELTTLWASLPDYLQHELRMYVKAYDTSHRESNRAFIVGYLAALMQAGAISRSAYTALHAQVYNREAHFLDLVQSKE